jgi:polygalacturonase
MMADETNIKLDIIQFGAIGDGKTINTEPIQKAIDECHKKGGGIIYLPPGNFVSGTLHLKDNITLYLEAGATLLGSQQEEDYDPNYLIYSENSHHISIEGKGIIDGQGDSFWNKNKLRGHIPFQRYQRKKFCPRAMIYLINCQNIIIKDITLINSSHFTVWPLGCDNVNIRGITIINNRKGPNTDGIDIDCSSNVHVSDCHIDAGDDCIAIKSDTNRLGNMKACENITVTNCTLITPCCGIRVGYEGDGPIRNCVFNNLSMINTRTGINMLVTRNPEIGINDGPMIENINFSDIVMDVKQAIYLWTGYEKQGPQKGYINNITINNIIAHAERSCYIGGLEENPIQSLQINNVKLILKGEMVDSFASGIPYPYYVWGVWKTRGLPYGFYCRYVEDIKFHNIQVEWKDISGDWKSALHCENIDNLEIHEFRARQAPKGIDVPAIHLTNVKRGLIHGCQALPETGIFLKLEGKRTEKIHVIGNDINRAVVPFELGKDLREKVIAQTANLLHKD